MKRRIRKLLKPLLDDEEMVGGDIEELDFTQLDHIGEQLDDPEELEEEGESDEDLSDDEELI